MALMPDEDFEGECYLSMMRLSMSSRQQPEVTPVVPFKNKIQYYQLK
jgi:hypothetical protein